jgi:hypothetical protein
MPAGSAEHNGGAVGITAEKYRLSHFDALLLDLPGELVEISPGNHQVAIARHHDHIASVLDPPLVVRRLDDVLLWRVGNECSANLTAGIDARAIGHHSKGNSA